MKDKINGNTKIYGIIGYPVKHSFSPKMLNAAFSKLKMNAVYLPFSVKPEEISQAIDGIRALNISGFNVTIPHKSSIIKYLDEITPIARKIGAVNTVININGRLIGTNTDAPGFISSLKALNFSPFNKNIGLIGAGGSARAVLVGLAESGVSRIIIYNRTLERAKKLESEFSNSFPEISIKTVSLDDIKNYHLDLLVNSSSVGMAPNESPIDLNLEHKIENIVDIIYSPTQTQLIIQAQKLGIPNINGLGMLLYQGCEAFKYWTDLPAPESTMQKQLLNLIN